MKETEFLDPDELAQLTGRRRAADQAKWLVEEGIPHKLCEKRVIVSRMHVRNWLEGRAVVVLVEPDFSSVR